MCVHVQTTVVCHVLMLCGLFIFCVQVGVLSAVILDAGATVILGTSVTVSLADLTNSPPLQVSL